LAVAAVVVAVRVGEGAAPPGGALVVAAVALFAAWFLRGPPRLALGIAGCGLLAFTMSARATDGARHSPLPERGEVTLRGDLTSDPSGPAYTASALVRVAVAGSHRTVLADASGDDAMRLRVLEAGDRVVLHGRLAPLAPTGFDDRARVKHAVAKLEQTEITNWSSPDGLFAVADGLRHVVLRGTRSLAPVQRGLVAGFLLGDTRAIPDDIAANYRDAGLSHLLAVSGENVAFVLALAGPLLRRLSLAPRTVLALTIVGVFATMTRFEPSVLRASAMAVIALLAAVAGRPAARIRVLAYAAIGLLIADPFLVHSVGFALSCGASAGIALLEPPIARKLVGPRFVREPLAVSLAAQAGVMPVLLTVFGTFPLVTPLANLLAAPAADALGVYGFVASAGAGVLPALGPLVQQPTALLVEWVSTVARVGAAVPLTLDVRGAFATTAIAAGAASLACLRARRSLSDVARR
jgi:competence protein ComEC